MKLLPEYLILNRKRIRTISQQVLPPWSSNFNGYTEDVMRRLYHRFPQRTIQRHDLINLYSKWDDPCLCFIATMIWGGIDTTKQNRLQNLLRYPETEIRERMRKTRRLIKRGLFSLAYISWSDGGENKIEGVGYSFFSKIFFFLGQSMESLIEKTLILDKWTCNAFFALFSQTAGITVSKDFFSIPSRETFDKYRVIYPKTNTDAFVYTLYVQHMNYWANALRVSPDRLEQFLFGEDLRRNSSRINPRNEISEIIRNIIEQVNQGDGE